MEPPTQELAVAPIQQEEQPVQEPIRDVQTFWDRLDEVLTLVKSGGVRSNKVEELLEAFPELEKSRKEERSFLFQPDRIFISSNNDVQSSPSVAYKGTTKEGHQPAETFSSFRIRLAKALTNVKSMQLLSAVIPNATQNFPDNQLIFFYYRLRTIANSSIGNWSPVVLYSPGSVVFNTADNNYYYALVQNNNSQPNVWPSKWSSMGSVGTRPNYYDLNSTNVQGVFIFPTFSLPPEDTGQYLLYNRTFEDYNDVVRTLNACAANVLTASIPGDLSFVYSPTLNKIQFQGSQSVSGTYFYLPCGYEDPNIAAALVNPNNNLRGLLAAYGILSMFSPGYTLNLRLGYTWNGLFPDPLTINPYENNNLAQILYFYLRKADPVFIINWNVAALTGNSYPDLVNTSCVRIYCDFTFGSTQDSEGKGGLLSIVPVNASNLGVGFYQNNFNNPLTKVPANLTEIGIRLLNDQGEPFILPNSATVSLELAVEYN